MWVRVGGGMESIPEHHRHGPADLDFPPPGGPWEALVLSGRVVGWADEGGLRVARKSAELGLQLVEQHRDHLLGRLGHKLRAYSLQDQGRDTVEANQDLGYEADLRLFQLPAKILKELGVGRVRLLSNNPQKLNSLTTAGIEVTERVPCEVEPQSFSKEYLKTKKEKLDGGVRCV